MKITEIESIPLRVPYEERDSQAVLSFWDRRTGDGL